VVSLGSSVRKNKSAQVAIGLVEETRPKRSFHRGSLSIQRIAIGEVSTVRYSFRLLLFTYHWISTE
jgi:hypothetical protein